MPLANRCCFHIVAEVGELFDDLIEGEARLAEDDSAGDLRLDSAIDCHADIQVDVLEAVKRWDVLFLGGWTVTLGCPECQASYLKRGCSAAGVVLTATQSVKGPEILGCLDFQGLEFSAFVAADVVAVAIQCLQRAKDRIGEVVVASPQGVLALGCFCRNFVVQEVYEFAGRNVAEHGRISILHSFRIYKRRPLVVRATHLYSVLKEW